MWSWESVTGMFLVMVGLGVMAGQSFQINGWVLVFWVAGAVLLFVRALHRDPPARETPNVGRRENPQLAAALTELRTFGLHQIRNEFEDNPRELHTYLAREREWATRIRETMTRFGCSTAEISRVMDVTNSEIGMAAIGATHGADGNWLIGLMEVRLKRLAQVIVKYEP